MKEPIQVDWRQYPIGTPAVLRNTEDKRELKLIHKFADNDVLFVCDETTLTFRRLFNGRVSDCEAFKADNDILLPWSHAIAEGHNPDKLTNEQVVYSLDCTYRLPIKPKLSAKDFPPGTVVRSTGAQDNWKMITSVYNDRIYTGPTYIMISDMNSGIERSLDGGKTWLSC